jgi:hypothetical protein
VHGAELTSQEWHDAEVRVVADVTGPDGGRFTTDLSLLTALCLAEMRRWRIHALHAPPTEAQTWYAVAGHLVEEPRPLSPLFLPPSPTVLVICGRVWDFQNLAAAPLADVLTVGVPTGFASQVPLGTALTHAVLRPVMSDKVKASRLRARVRTALTQARKQGGAAGATEVARLAAAEALSEVLANPADAGAPPAGFWIVRSVLGGSAHEVLAESVAASGPGRRRDREFRAAVKAVEDSVFGVGVHSPRGRRRFVSQDELHEDERGRPTSLLDYMEDEGASGAFDALIEALSASSDLEAVLAVLEPDERALVEARLADPSASLSAIADTHGWDLKAVEAVWKRVQYKGRKRRP